uniref:Uncharacterized protein n=1 Tax=Branchiostoma floridae TaxID=7739 RepID=C3Z6U7_BRAFL|eukprot:XP_002595531.1 hypothetical protein BRAFLDRAFT_130427 [Branchiostoma floridae]
MTPTTPGGGHRLLSQPAIIPLEPHSLQMDPRLSNMNHQPRQVVLEQLARYGQAGGQPDSRLSRPVQSDPRLVRSQSDPRLQNGQAGKQQDPRARGGIQQGPDQSVSQMEQSHQPVPNHRGEEDVGPQRGPRLEHAFGRQGLRQQGPNHSPPQFPGNQGGPRPPASQTFPGNQGGPPFQSNQGRERFPGHQGQAAPPSQGGARFPGGRGGAQFPGNQGGAQFPGSQGGWVHSVCFSGSGEKLCWVGHDSSLSVVDSANGMVQSSTKTEFLPFLSCTWVTNNSLVVAGHGCLPMLYLHDDQGNITFLNKLDQSSSKSSGDSTISAMKRFQTMDRMAATEVSTTDPNTIHQNTITQVMVHTGTKDGCEKFVTIAMDGKMVIWDFKPVVHQPTKLSNSPVTCLVLSHSLSHDNKPNCPTVLLLAWCCPTACRTSTNQTVQQSCYLPGAVPQPVAHQQTKLSNSLVTCLVLSHSLSYINQPNCPTVLLPAWCCPTACRTINKPNCPTVLLLAWCCPTACRTSTNQTVQQSCYLPGAVPQPVVHQRTKLSNSPVTCLVLSHNLSYINKPNCPTVLLPAWCCPTACRTSTNQTVQQSCYLPGAVPQPVVHQQTKLSNSLVTCLVLSHSLSYINKPNCPTVLLLAWGCPTTCRMTTTNKTVQQSCYLPGVVQQPVA